MSTAPRVGRREQKRFDLERRVRDTAWDLVSERGYSEVTVEDIATGAGVSVATFYRHFAGKDMLLTRRWLSAERLVDILPSIDRDHGLPGAARSLFETYAGAVDAYDVDLLTRLTVIHRDVGLQVAMTKGRNEDVATLAGIYADIVDQPPRTLAIQLAAALTATARITTMGRWAELGGLVSLQVLLAETAETLAPALASCETATFTSRALVDR
jgi:AcrR family transcriptional regulator